MSRQFVWVYFVVAAVVAVVLAGCGGNAIGPPAGGGDDTVTTYKIDEYVGDGGGAKTTPELTSGEVTPAGGDTTLAPGAPVRWGTVPYRRTQWYSFMAKSGRQLVTLQPLEESDPDLYLLAPTGNAPYDIECLEFSNRGLPGEFYGLAPDWVCYNFREVFTLRFNVAVFGYGKPPGNLNPYTIEMDIPGAIAAGGAVNGIPLGAGDSDWYHIVVAPGLPYTVNVVAVAGIGDPDLYVYGENSTQFVASSTLAGNDSVSFTAYPGYMEDGQWYHVRVYGFSACTYNINVTSP